MSTNAVKNARFGKLACAVAALTIVILVGNVGILAYRLLSSGPPAPEVEQSEADRSKEKPRVVVAEAPKPAIPVIEVKMVPPEETKLPRMETQAEAQEAPARVAAAPAPTRMPTTNVLVAEPPMHDFLGRTMITAASIFAVGIVAPVVFAMSLFGLFRRHGQRFGPLIRIEFAGSTPMVVAPPVAAATPAQMVPVNHNRFAEVQALPASPQPAEPLNLESAFDQERLLKEQRVGKAEEAVLQHLFENNLKLYEQIDRTKTK